MRRKAIQRKPRPYKFMFAICLSGQMSNHLICLEKHMFFAALLDRSDEQPLSHSFGPKAAVQTRLVSSPTDLETHIIHVLNNTVRDSNQAVLETICSVIHRAHYHLSSGKSNPLFDYGVMGRGESGGSCNGSVIKPLQWLLVVDEFQDEPSDDKACFLHLNSQDKLDVTSTSSSSEKAISSATSSASHHQR
ncbi:hypothetical protein Bca4012_044502 [Brassica carinata]